MSSVDDPEKHFLGNLLEDDPGSPSMAPPFSRNRNTETTSTAALPQLTNVGPVMRPVAGSDMSHAWPEPPPPYSPPLESWGLSSNANMTLISPPGPLSSNWFPFSERKETTTTAADILGAFGALNGSSSSATPASPARAHPPSPQIHHFHHNLHHHTHTHNVQVQNHYFGTPPPGLEAYGPRSTTTATSSSSSPSSQQKAASSTVPQYDSMRTSSSLFDYTGLAEINTNSNSLLFSDWKNKNMCQASPEPTASSESTISLASPREEPEKEPLHLPLSPKEVVEVAKEKKNVSKSYAEHLSKTTAAASAAVSPGKKGIPIGAEKKQKQELEKKMSSQTIGESSATRILVKGQPHSAPVVSKMPFSYRDVAARVEHNSGANHAIHHNDEMIAAQQEKKETSSAETTKTSETKAVQTKTSELLLNETSKDESKKIESSGRKSRADNEFQKISSRKNKKDQKSHNGTVVAPLVYDPVHPVDASSRYDVLKNLESLPVQQRACKKNSNGRPPLIQEIYSRSSSPAEDLEDTESEETRARSASNHAHLSGNSQMKKEQKKRVVQANQRRRKGRKTEPSWFDNMLTSFGDFLLLAWSYMVHMFQWTFELIVDVCVKIYDVVLCSCECLYIGAWRGVRKVFMVLIGCFYHLMVWFKQSAFIVSSFTIVNVLGFKPEEDEEMELDWGCKKELPIPTNPTEYADRLSRETICDAYSVFGLKCDCSDDDIKRNYKRLSALVSPDKCQIEAAEEVFALVNTAFEAIGNQEARAIYTVENSKENEAHAKVIKQWKEMTARVEEVRNTINCDCSKRHLRIATDIAPSQARYCKRCTIKHPAKQNDIWVEKRHLGLTSVYLTCTDNVVYDITEWATCESQRAMLKNMRAHTHHVQYRLLPPLNTEFDSPSTFFNSAMNYSSTTTDARFLNDLEEYSSILRQRSLAQISFKTCEPREEDRSRRAANRRQKRWR